VTSTAPAVGTYAEQRAAATPRVLRSKRARGSALRQWLFVLPALAAYATFVLWPVIDTVKYSFYNWDGIATAQWAGFQNYKTVFSNNQLLSVIGHSFELILFFSVVPIVLGLAVATVMRRFVTGKMSTVARTVLFLPQVVPLVAAGIAWSWMLSTTGAVDEVLKHIGLGSLAQAWLGGFNTALPAVGVIGAWVLLGLCTVLLLTGMSKIDPLLYEAAQLDGASPLREFVSITLPQLRQEIGVCVTVTVIAALSAFDIVYISTQGGPGTATMVPGLEIYQLAFYNRQVGLASALAVVLIVLVLLCIMPVQWFTRRETGR
jgi:raffinose/stachyose/melibiose transport system permease protein